MQDIQIQNLISLEEKRQKSVINLIASENYVSKDVLQALGSVLTNKYSEGYPGKRYYGGNLIIDQIELLCQQRALDLFKLDSRNWAVNVQALSGSSANFTVFFALLPIYGRKLKDGTIQKKGKIMGMSLEHGGHLTHGHNVSASGIFWDSVGYGVDKNTHLINYDLVQETANKEKPDMIIAGYTAYPRFVDFKRMREIANSCGAILMVDMSHISGLVAGEVYESPFKYADVVTTTTHKTLRGPRSALIFSKIDNRNFNQKIDKALFPGLQGGPHNNQIASVAVALKEASTKEFKKYANQVVKNAKVLSLYLSEQGFKIISNGTDTHLILVDVWNNGFKTDTIFGGLSGKIAEEMLEKNGIIVNKNTVPYETRSPFDPSGIRLGTSAETTLNKTEEDFIEIGKKISKILKEEV